MVDHCATLIKMSLNLTQNLIYDRKLSKVRIFFLNNIWNLFVPINTKALAKRFKLWRVLRSTTNRHSFSKVVTVRRQFLGGQVVASSENFIVSFYAYLTFVMSKNTSVSAKLLQDNYCFKLEYVS